MHDFVRVMGVDKFCMREEDVVIDFSHPLVAVVVSI